MSMLLNIDRKYYGDCTFGRVSVGRFNCFSIELKQCNNQQNIGCIPEGTYECRKITSPSKGECFEIINVKGRTDVLGHIGNFLDDTLGCVLFGLRFYHLNNGQPAISNSKDAFDAVMKELNDEFILVISS